MILPSRSAGRFRGLRLMIPRGFDSEVLWLRPLKQGAGIYF
jgi:hypothetical protein